MHETYFTLYKYNGAKFKYLDLLVFWSRYIKYASNTVHVVTLEIIYRFTNLTANLFLILSHTDIPLHPFLPGYGQQILRAIPQAHIT